MSKIPKDKRPYSSQKTNFERRVNVSNVAIPASGKPKSEKPKADKILRKAGNSSDVMELRTNRSYYPNVKQAARKQSAKSGAKPKAASKLKK
jgi:hypothetical protein